MFWEEEIEQIYNNLSISDRRTLSKWAQILHGEPTTKKEFFSLLKWTTTKGLEHIYIPDEIQNRILKNCGKELKIYFKDLNLTIQ